MGGSGAANIHIGAPEMLLNSYTGVIKPEQVLALQNCVKYLSDAICKCPIRILNPDGEVADVNDVPENRLLLRPNPYQTFYKFHQSKEVNRNWHGNGLAYIQRSKGQPVGLYVVARERVAKYEIKGTRLIYYIKNEHGKEVAVDSENVLHVSNYSLDGIWGLNPLEIARVNYEAIGKTMSAVDKHMDGGLFGVFSLESTAEGGALGKEVQKAQKNLETAKGYIGTNKIVPLPPGHQLKNIPVALKDAEFLASINANAAVIASFYGVPKRVATGDDPKYNSFEQSMLEFRQSTVSTIAEQYDQEYTYKLLTQEKIDAGYKAKMDTTRLTATDALTQARIDESFFKIGVKSGGQIAKANGLPSNYEGADKRFIMTNNLSDINSVEDGSGLLTSDENGKDNGGEKD